MTAADSQFQTGPWQKIYWLQGPQAAQDYCAQVRSQLNERYSALSSIDHPHLKVPVEKIKGFYKNKINQYSCDRSLCPEFISHGRAEPGKCPFNYPDFRRRYYEPAQLSDFFDSKIRQHRNCLEIMEELLKARPQNVKLNEIFQIHAKSLKKWMERKKEFRKKPKAFLLPAAKPPLKAMNIHWAHANGYFGKGAATFVLENGGADFLHPDLRHAFSGNTQNAPCKINSEEHGTIVCGIIAAKTPTKWGPIGVARRAKIRVLTDYDEILNSAFKIVNWSGRQFDQMAYALNDSKYTFLAFLERELKNSPNDRLKKILSEMRELTLMFNWNEVQSELWKLCKSAREIREGGHYYFRVFINKLVIIANGNDGVILSENKLQLFQNSYCLERPYREHSIRVVNLLPNALYPAPSSTLPGEKFAEITICAIGTNVLTTLPDNEYGESSGTSVATPFVSGVALQINGRFPELNEKEIRRCILDGATQIILDKNYEPRLITNPVDLQKYTPEQIRFSQRFFGMGLLNAKGAIEKAKELMATKEKP